MHYITLCLNSFGNSLDMLLKQESQKSTCASQVRNIGARSSLTNFYDNNKIKSIGELVKWTENVYTTKNINYPKIIYYC